VADRGASVLHKESIDQNGSGESAEQEKTAFDLDFNLIIIILIKLVFI
jgi:hypothetical protein